jgi:membrane protease YdiL (CAAX protease family)
MNRRISLRDILSLAGSYLWTIALIIAGSLVGAVLTSALISALYGLMAKDGMHLMRDALMGEGPAALGLPAQGTGYSISWTSIVYTAGRYLAPVGIWAAFLLYLAHSKTSRPILGILGPHYGSNTLRHFVLGLGLGCALNGICVLAAALSGSIHLSFIGTDALGLILVFVCVFIQASAEELAVRCYLYERTLRTCGSSTRPGTSRRPYSSVFRTPASRPHSRSSASLLEQRRRLALPTTPSSVSKPRPSAAWSVLLPAWHSSSMPETASSFRTIFGRIRQHLPPPDRTSILMKKRRRE